MFPKFWYAFNPFSRFLILNYRVNKRCVTFGETKNDVHVLEFSRKMKKNQKRKKEKSAAFSILDRWFHTRWVRIVKNRGGLLTSGWPGAAFSPSLTPHKGIINASQSRCGAERIASIKCNFGRVSDTKFWIEPPPPGYFHLNGETFASKFLKLESRGGSFVLANDWGEKSGRFSDKTPSAIISRV